jgi:hypothetical protein
MIPRRKVRMIDDELTIFEVTRFSTYGWGDGEIMVWLRPLTEETAQMKKELQRGSKSRLRNCRRGKSLPYRMSRRVKNRFRPSKKFSR